VTVKIFNGGATNLYSPDNKRAHVVMTVHWDWVLYNFRLPLARALRENGYQVTFVCPAGHYLSKVEAEGFSCVRWKISRKSLNPFREAGSIVHLAGIYRRLKPDIVHHFCVKPNLYGTLAASFSHVPAVINTFTGLGYLLYDSLRARILLFFLNPFFRWAINHPNAVVIFQSESDRRILKEKNILASGAKVFIIPGSGVDIDRFKGKAYSGMDLQRGKKPVVLMASRLLWDKGVKEFIGMAQTLKNQGVQAEFWIAGAPDKGNPECISDSEIEKWSRQGDVKFLGHQDDIFDILSQTDIAVLPSYHEGVPRFLLEAASAGLPLIATDAGGCRMIVHDGVNGYVVPAKNVTALAEAVGRLINDPDLRNRMGEASRQIAVKEFDETKIDKQFLEIYNGLQLIS